MQMQKTWDSIMNAPIALDDIVFAEMLWAAFKSLFSVAAQDLARSCRLNLPFDDPRVVALYRAWGEAMALYPDHEAVEAGFNRARDAFIAEVEDGES